ncbi:MAG TPA: biotin--[acetyl-CoA-carboxylase] ligase, partial [Vicinamibacterales bacterium]|nr:biotin--[acetyl-CoA-carboxylase] ligase [Vicinamibacterales bacterium]
EAALREDPRVSGWADLRYFAEVGSTNDIALQLAAAGAREGTAVLAEVQRSGRGRRGHVWHSPPGTGVYLSAIVRPHSSALQLVTLAAGVAAARAIAALTALPIELKWPNDVVIGRPWRKVGGVLCEATGSAGRIDAVVIGIGLNVGEEAYPPELAGRATSLESELGREVDRDRVVVELLAQLREIAGRLGDADASWVPEAWRTFGRAGLGGAPVRWREAEVERRGLARDLDADGALVVDANGVRTRVIAGEVTWERMS